MLSFTHSQKMDYMFTQKDVADYYNTTQIHYEQWWNLKSSLSLHYGIWEKGVSSFKESLVQTNRTLMNLAEISSADKVLDAGCGVGGAAIFLCENRGVEVVGITLSERQIALAKQSIKAKKLQDKISFSLMDYTQTSFKDESFDVVWACESVSSAMDKTQFIKEAFRVLKKGGRLILSDFFLTNKNQQDPKSLMEKWGATWGISHFVASDVFVADLNKQGFTQVKTYDYTNKIRKSAKRMYYASAMAAIPSELYNLFHPNVSRFAKTHYKCGYYQYKALQENLWRYVIVSAVK